MVTARVERTFLAAVVASAILAAGSCSSAPETQKPAATNLVVQVRFTAMWWSKAQMEGLNPNNPPPKNTEVELARWEYTDPVGVPHPDVADVLITIENRGTTPVLDLMVTTQGTWKVGPLEDESSAKWGEAIVLGKADRVQIPAVSTQTMRVPVNLKQMMDSLEPQDQWPFVLRVNVSVEQLGGEESLARTQIDLPIRPGN